VFVNIGSAHKDLWINWLKVLIGIQKSHFGSEGDLNDPESGSRLAGWGSASSLVSEHIKSSLFSIEKEGKIFLSHAAEKKR
jgi:hypothetical protein